MDLKGTTLICISPGAWPAVSHGKSPARTNDATMLMQMRCLEGLQIEQSTAKSHAQGDKRPLGVEGDREETVFITDAAKRKKGVLPVL